MTDSVCGVCGKDATFMEATNLTSGVRVKMFCYDHKGLSDASRLSLIESCEASAVRAILRLGDIDTPRSRGALRSIESELMGVMNTSSKD